MLRLETVMVIRDGLLNNAHPVTRQSTNASQYTMAAVQEVEGGGTRTTLNVEDSRSYHLHREALGTSGRFEEVSTTRTVSAQHGHYSPSW